MEESAIWSVGRTKWFQQPNKKKTPARCTNYQLPPKLRATGRKELKEFETTPREREEVAIA